MTSAENAAAAILARYAIVERPATDDACEGVRMTAYDLRNSHRGMTVRVIEDGTECVIDHVTHSRSPYLVTVQSDDGTNVTCLYLPWDENVEVFA